MGLSLSSRRIAVSAFTLYAFSVAYTIVSILIRVEPPHWIISSTTLLFFVFAVFHAANQLGVRSMLVFLSITFVVSFVFETVGVLTGLIYGAYYYTNKLGPKLGVVPVLIPIAWFMMMYASYAIVHAVTGKTRARSLGWSVWRALLGAMAMTAWDFGMDPQMVARGHWVWTQGGEYFGIPVQNFIGWLATTFTVFFLFHLSEKFQSPRELKFDNNFARLSIAAYAVQGTATVIAGSAQGQSAPALVTFFAMGAFLLVAITRVVSMRGEQ